MKNGICPKCNHSEVYAGTELMFKQSSNDTNTIPISSWASAALDNYVCGNCGYVESYIAEFDKLAKIRKNWPKVNPIPKS